MLRRPHDCHRDFRARAPAARAATEQGRQAVIITPSRTRQGCRPPPATVSCGSRSPKARRSASNTPQHHCQVVVNPPRLVRGSPNLPDRTDAAVRHSKRAYLEHPETEQAAPPRLIRPAVSSPYMRRLLSRWILIGLYHGRVSFGGGVVFWMVVPGAVPADRSKAEPHLSHARSRGTTPVSR